MLHPREPETQSTLAVAVFGYESSEKAMSRTPDTHIGGESEGRVLPTTCLNNDGNPSAEGMDGGRPSKENIEQTIAPRTQRWTSASSGSLAVRQVARKNKRQRRPESAFGHWESVIGHWLEHRTRRYHELIGICMFVVIGLLKAEAGPQVVFSALSLLQVSYMTWFVSPSAGIATAIGSASTLLVLNLAMVHKYSTVVVPFWNAGMDLVVFVVFTGALSEMKNLYVRARELSREDPLTGLLNRRAFSEALTIETRRARRYQCAMTLAYIDLDNFKSDQ